MQHKCAVDGARIDVVPPHHSAIKIFRQPGYNAHHIVERTPAPQDGFTVDEVDSPENLVLVPTLTHWLITAWFATQNDNFGGLSPREYPRGKSWDERLRVGEDALNLFGVLQP